MKPAAAMIAAAQKTAPLFNMTFLPLKENLHEVNAACVGGALISINNPAGDGNAPRFSQ